MAGGPSWRRTPAGGGVSGRRGGGLRVYGLKGGAHAAAPTMAGRPREKVGKGPWAAMRCGGRAAASAQSAAPPSPHIDFDALGFGLTETDSMFVVETDPGTGAWREGALQPFGNVSMSPAAQVLNYGQSAFEGMKAQRTPAGDIVLFRPDQNAARLAAGAQRLSMPPVPEELFVRAVEETVRANAGFVPPHGKGTLYIRPLLFGSGAILGLGPAPSYTFLVYCSPVGAYFKGGQLTPIRLLVEERFHRAAPGGMGGTKAAGNYSPVLVTQLSAKKEGYADVLYLDAVSDTYIEEVSSCNIFVRKGKSIKTPPLSGTILPGITRKSVIELARTLGYDVEEAPVSVTELVEADEVFTTGTAVVVCPVGSITYQGKEVKYGDDPEQPGPTTLEIYDALTSIQAGTADDTFGWVHRV